MAQLKDLIEQKERRAAWAALAAKERAEEAKAKAKATNDGHTCQCQGKNR